MFAPLSDHGDGDGETVIDVRMIVTDREPLVYIALHDVGYSVIVMSLADAC